MCPISGCWNTWVWAWDRVSSFTVFLKCQYSIIDTISYEGRDVWPREKANLIKAPQLVSGHINFHRSPCEKKSCGFQVPVKTVSLRPAWRSSTRRPHMSVYLREKQTNYNSLSNQLLMYKWNIKNNQHFVGKNEEPIGLKNKIFFKQKNRGVTKDFGHISS